MSHVWFRPTEFSRHCAYPAEQVDGHKTPFSVCGTWRTRVPKSGAVATIPPGACIKCAHTLGLRVKPQAAKDVELSYFNRKSLTVIEEMKHEPFPDSLRETVKSDEEFEIFGENNGEAKTE